MNDAVVDSCVIAKWFVPEPDSPLAQRVMTDTIAAGGRLIALDLVLPRSPMSSGKNTAKPDHACRGKGRPG